MEEAIVTKISGREILDSRGNPTLAVAVALQDGTFATASVPSGASTGSHEAYELRDGDMRRYGGSGVRKAVANVNEVIATVVVGKLATEQRRIDRLMIELDGTENKSKLGANAILGASLAVARAAAASNKIPLYQYLRQTFFPHVSGWRIPTPMCNVLNGGMHAGWSVDIQEFMLLPQLGSAEKNIQCAAEVFHALGKILAKRRYPTTVGDEGGFAPKLPGNEAALKLLTAAVTAAGFRLGTQVKIGIDVAASGFYRNGKYRLQTDGRVCTSRQMIALYRKWVEKYPIATIEDGLAEDDWDGWEELTTALGKTVKLVGDDIFVTSTKRLRQGVERGIANAVLIKPNQIGTLTETTQTMMLAREHAYALAVSHRSGETADDFIVDLAVASGAEYLKAGSMSRGERIAKWNRLIEIAEALR